MDDGCSHIVCRALHTADGPRMSKGINARLRFIFTGRLQLFYKHYLHYLCDQCALESRLVHLSDCPARAQWTEARDEFDFLRNHLLVLIVVHLSTDQSVPGMENS